MVKPRKKRISTKNQNSPGIQGKSSRRGRKIIEKVEIRFALKNQYLPGGKV